MAIVAALSAQQISTLQELAGFFVASPPEKIHHLGARSSRSLTGFLLATHYTVNGAVLQVHRGQAAAP
jgi:hypothetical protein